jgi:type I restriction enzyme M protein
MRFPNFTETRREEYADPEERDEYIAENIFWVPKEARWSFLQNNAKQPTIGQLLDEAMDAIEKENPSLKGVLPKEYGKPALDKRLLGELIDLVGKIGLGDAQNRSKDILGRVYEYFWVSLPVQRGRRGDSFTRRAVSCSCWWR